MKLATNMLVLYFYSVTTAAANAMPVRRNVFSRRVFTSVGVGGAHRAFATKKEKDKEIDKKENTETSKHEIINKKYWENQEEGRGIT